MNSAIFPTMAMVTLNTIAAGCALGAVWLSYGPSAAFGAAIIAGNAISATVAIMREP